MPDRQSTATIELRTVAFFMNPLRKVNMREVIKQALRKNESEIIEQQQIQMQAGQDSQGQQIRPAYTPFTKRMKREKGQPTDRVTLKDTGDFYAKQYAAFKADHLEIRSRDKKSPALVEKYGSAIFGLARPAVESVAYRIKPEAQMIYRDKLLKSRR